MVRRKRKPGSIGLRLLQFGQARMETYLPEGSLRSRSDAPASNDIMRAVIAASESAPEAYYQPERFYQDEVNDAVDYDYQQPSVPSRNVTSTPPPANQSNSPVVRPSRNPAPTNTPTPAPQAPVQQQRGTVLQRDPAPQQSAQPTNYGTPQPAEQFAPPPNRTGQDNKPTPPDLWAILRSHEQRAEDEESAPTSNPDNTRQPDVQRKPATDQRTASRSAPAQNQPQQQRDSSPAYTPNDNANNSEAPIIRRRPIIHESTPYQRAIAAEQGNTKPESTPDFSSVGFDPGDLEPDYDDDFVDYDPFEENDAPPITRAPQTAPPIQAQPIDAQDNTRQNPPRESTPETQPEPQTEANNTFNENDRIVQSIIDQAIPPMLQKRPQPQNPTEQRDERVQPPPDTSINANVSNPPAVTDAARPLASKQTPEASVPPSAQPSVQRRPLPRFSDTSPAPDVGELPVKDRLDLPTIDGDDGPTEKVHYDDAPLKRISNSPFTYYSAPNQMPQEAPPVHPRGDVVRRQPNAPNTPQTVSPPQKIQRQESAPDNGTPQDASLAMPYFDEGGAGDSGEEESSIVRLRRMLDDQAQRAPVENTGTAGNNRQQTPPSETTHRPPEADLLQLLNLPPDTPIAGLRRQSAPQNDSPDLHRAPSDDDDDADYDDHLLQSVPLDVALMGGNVGDVNLPVQREPATRAPAMQDNVALGDERGENSEGGEDLNVDSLARDVLKRLRQRLRIDQERRSKK